MNTLQLTNEQAWNLSMLLAQHSNRISKEYGSEADAYAPILEQLYKDIPTVKQFKDELDALISNSDAGYDGEVEEWTSRLQAWRNNEWTSRLQVWRDEDTTDARKKCCDDDFVVRFPLNIFPRVVMRYPA